MDPFNYLLGVVQSLYGALVSVINFVVGFFQYVANILYAYIVAVVQFLIAGFRILLSFLSHAVSDLLHGRFRDLWNDYIRFRDALRAWLAPLRAALDAYRRTWRALFNTYLKPVLQLITSLRRVLVVFRLLHMKWATALDGYLSNIESKIVGAYQTVLRAINRHADFLYLLTTPLGFLRIVPLLHAVALASEDLLLLFTGRGKSFWLRGTPASTPAKLPRISIADQWADRKRQAAANSGDAGSWASSFSQITAHIAGQQ